MKNDDYEIILGKLVILKLFLTEKYRNAIDGVMEELEAEYLVRRNNKEL